MTVWFDVEDLFHYIRSGNKRISGIQRLTLEIYRAAHQLAGGTGRIGFVRHGSRLLSFKVVEWAEIAAQFEADEQTEAQPPRALAPLPASGLAPPRRSGLRGAAANLANRLPDEVRRPLVLASVMQVQAAGELGRAGFNLLRYPAVAAARHSRRVAGDMGWALAARVKASATRPAREPARPSFDDLARPGDTVLVLGSPWFRQDYSAIARWLRDERRIRFGLLVHDLVPIRRPEWCHAGIARTFEGWYADLLPFCDLVLANSRHTAGDVEAYAAESGITLPGPVRPVPVGTGFGLPAAGERPAHLPEAGSYVLFVSTMEARKNHALVVRVWRKLLDEVQAGTRPASSVPDLLFAGRVGWLVADLMQQLENTQWLGGRVRMIRDPSDADLRALYQGSLFTVFPSLHEGWGLPVTESLALGTPCLSSNAAALPEAGGALCRYFDPEDAGSAHRAVAALLDDRPGLEAWRAQVRREFRPTPWTDTAQAVLDRVAELDGAAARP